jgi:hypothetical protein
MLDLSAIVYSVYEAAERAGFRWHDPRPVPGGDGPAFQALLVPPGADEEDAVACEAHVHAGGDSCLFFSIPLRAAEDDNPYRVAAQAQVCLANADPEDEHPVEVLIQERVDASGVPRLERVWAQVHHDVTAELQGERRLDAESVVDDLRRKLGVLRENGLYGSAEPDREEQGR